MDRALLWRGIETDATSKATGYRIECGMTFKADTERVVRYDGLERGSAGEWREVLVLTCIEGWLWRDVWWLWREVWDLGCVVGIKKTNERH